MRPLPASAGLRIIRTALPSSSPHWTARCVRLARSGSSTTDEQPAREAGQEHISVASGARGAARQAANPGVQDVESARDQRIHEAIAPALKCNQTNAFQDPQVSRE